jgi:MmyB-like transcription regulator ligand binding domain/Helix-turn-helix domain
VGDGPEGEVASLCHMSTDCYARLERERGPQPSEQMIASIAQGLHLSLDERDHLFRLAGHNPPTRGASSEHISPGLLRVLDRLDDTPAEIVTELGETLRQSPLGVALTGDTTDGIRPDASKRFVHPELGALELNRQTLLDPEQGHLLFVYTAVPGSESHDKLRLLSVIGTQALRSGNG